MEMFVLLTITDLVALETFLVSIPESLRLLAFGVALVGLAVLGRWLLNKVDDVKDKEKITNKAEVR